jgi:hypothetical protein
MFRLNCIILICLFNVNIMAQDLWVDANFGNDNNDGLTQDNPLKTIQAAANLAQAGTTVHIQAGIYRESIRPKYSGNAAAPIIYQAVDKGKVIMRGSEIIQDWQILSALNLFPNANLAQVLKVKTTNLNTYPRFLVMMEDEQITTRYPLAREPNWFNNLAWKVHQNWWLADGGFASSNCNARDEACIAKTRSINQLTDQNNLANFNDLVGANLIALDAVQGDHIFRRKIITHDKNLALITLDEPAYRRSINNPGLGWGSRYYVENHPELLDNYGEYWWQDNWLYVHTGGEMPTNLEFSHWDYAWDLTDRSHIILQDLQIELYNQAAIKQNNQAAQSSEHNYFYGLNINYVNYGLYLSQIQGENPASTNNYRLESSNLTNIDSSAVWVQSIASIPENPLPYPIISNIYIQNNYLKNIGLNSDNGRGVGIWITYPDKLFIKNNQLEYIAHDAIRLDNSSVIAENKLWGFSDTEITLGDILIAANQISLACLAGSECGGIHISGIPPQQHVFKRVLLIDNIVQYNYGWADIAQRRNLWEAGNFAYGIFLNDVSGIHAYRNILHNNSWAGLMVIRNWRSDKIMFYNNLTAGARRGIDIWNAPEQDIHGNLGLHVVNNIIINNTETGFQHTVRDNETNFISQNNLYYANGWSSGTSIMQARHVNFPSLLHLHSATAWEQHSIEDNPALVLYSYTANRQTQQNSRLLDLPYAFALNSNSPAIDAGNELAPELIKLLEQFNIPQPIFGNKLDIGVEEFVPQFTFSQASAIDLKTGAELSSNSLFDAKVITANHSGNQIYLDQQEMVQLVVEVSVAENEQGQYADLYLVANFQPEDSQHQRSIMRQGELWHNWYGGIEFLRPDANIYLSEKLYIPIASGKLQNLMGRFQVVVGYVLPETEVMISNIATPLVFTVQ